MGFFNERIALAGASLGFEQPDVDFTKKSLEEVFSRCCSSPAAVIPPNAGAQLQAICTVPNCPLDRNANCAAYPNGGPVEQPVIANATLVGNVTKENETAAATTAVWPAHCVYARDVAGTKKEHCAFETSAATGATQSNGADTTASDGGSSSRQWVKGMIMAGVFRVIEVRIPTYAEICVSRALQSSS